MIQIKLNQNEFSKRHVRTLKIASVTLPKITDSHHHHQGKNGGWRHGIVGMVQKWSTKWMQDLGVIELPGGS